MSSRLRSTLVCAQRTSIQSLGLGSAGGEAEHGCCEPVAVASRACPAKATAPSSSSSSAAARHDAGRPPAALVRVADEADDSVTDRASSVWLVSEGHVASETCRPCSFHAFMPPSR